MRNGQYTAHRLTSRKRTAILCIALLIYVVLFFVIFLFAQRGMSIAAIIPVIAVAQLFGLIPGICAGLLSMPLNCIMYCLIGIDWWSGLYAGGAGLTGTAGLVVIGTVVGGVHDLTLRLRRELDERTQAEDSLKKANDFIENIFDTTGDGIFVTDEQGTIIRANKTYREMSGYTEAEIKGMHVSQLVPETMSRDVFAELMKELFEKGSIVHHESLHRRKNGSGYPVEENISLLKDPDGVIIGGVCSIRDITERRLTEKALEKSLDRFRGMAENIQDGVVIIENEKIVFVNNRMSDITGYAKSELMMMKSSDLTTPEDRHLVEDAFRVYQKEGSIPRDLEFWIKRKDGIRRCIHNRYSPSYRDGKLAGRYVVTTDITDRKLFEEKVIETGNYLNNIIESSLDSIVITDGTGTVRRVNRAFSELTGYTPDEVVGRHMVELSPQKGSYESTAGERLDLDEAYFTQRSNVIKNLVATRKVVNWETHIVRKDEKIVPLEGNIVYLYDNQNSMTGALGILRDITERRRADREREHLISELRDALQNIRTLKGLLPICSYCKKIRDDKGYWNRIEQYILAHSEAEFTHGLCPECAGKLYPDLYEDTRKEQS